MTHKRQSVYNQRVSSVALPPGIPLCGMNRLKVLAKTSGGAGFSALAGGGQSITNHVETAVTGSVRASGGVLSPVLEKTHGRFY